jgi:hypothetical protein
MELTIRKSEWMSDWYIIERAEHDGREWLEDMGDNVLAYRCSSRMSDADVEGPAAEMLAIAGAIEERSKARFKRCAVRVEGDRVFFHSPRNSREDGECSLEEADRLAAKIRAAISGGL